MQSTLAHGAKMQAMKGTLSGRHAVWAFVLGRVAVTADVCANLPMFAMARSPAWPRGLVILRTGSFQLSVSPHPSGGSGLTPGDYMHLIVSVGGTVTSRLSIQTNGWLWMRTWLAAGRALGRKHHGRFADVLIIGRRVSRRFPTVRIYERCEGFTDRSGRESPSGRRIINRSLLEKPCIRPTAFIRHCARRCT